MVEDRLNIIAIWFRSVVNVLVPLFSVPILLSALGVEVFGLWQFSSQLAAALLLLDLGVTNASIRVFSQVEGSTREPAAIKASFVFFFFSSIALALISWPGGLLISWQISGYEKLLAGFPLFAVCFLYASLSILMRGFTAYLFSRHRYVFVNLTESFGAFAKLLLLYHLYRMDELSLELTCLVIFGIQLAVQLLQSLYAVLLGFKTFRSCILTALDFSAFRYLISQSVASLQVTIGALILNSGFIFFLGFKNEFELIVVVSLAAYLMITLTPFPQTFVTVMVPHAAKIRQKEDAIIVFNGMLTAIRLAMLPLCCIAVFILLVGPWAFGLWLDEAMNSKQMINELSVLVGIMLAAYALTFLANFLKIYILGVGNHRLPGQIDIASSIAGVVLSIASYYSNLGVYSVAIGYCFTLIVRLVFYLYLVNKQPEFEIWHFATSIFYSAVFLFLMFVSVWVTWQFEYVVMWGDREIALLAPCTILIAIVFVHSIYRQRQTYQSFLFGE